MATLKLSLFIDITNRKLVTGSIGYSSAFVMPRLSDVDKISIELQTLELSPTGGPQAPYTIVSPSGLTATVAVGSTNAATIYASQTSFTAGTDTLNGTLDLNTTEMVTAFTGVTRIEAIFAVQIVDASGSVVAQSNVIIDKSLIRAGTPTTSPTASYYTTDQINALFAKKIGLPGETITFIDSGNAYGRILGVNTDGSAMDNTYTI